MTTLSLEMLDATLHMNSKDAAAALNAKYALGIVAQDVASARRKNKMRRTKPSDDEVRATVGMPLAMALETLSISGTVYYDRLKKLGYGKWRSNTTLATESQIIDTLDMSAEEAARLLGCSDYTIRRRRSEYGLEPGEEATVSNFDVTPYLSLLEKAKEAFLMDTGIAIQVAEAAGNVMAGRQHNRNY